MKFSKREIFDLLKAWIAVSIAFTILFKVSLHQGYLVTFVLSLLTVGTGFLLHELGHKFVAQRYKHFAEFKSFDFMLILAIISSFLGFIFAAPGAVFISGNLNKKKNGIISLTGPLINIFLAMLFFVMLKLNFLSLVSDYGFRINSWLALFNLIPVWELDGAKVFRWNKMIYSIFALISLILVFSSFVM